MMKCNQSLQSFVNLPYWPAQKGMAQRKLAKRLRNSIASARFETGNTNPTLSFIQKSQVVLV